MLQIIIALIVSIAALIVVSRYLKLHPFFSLILASILFGTIMGKPLLETITSMQAGFGSLLQQIGFLVAIGSCLGMVMERTGAMTSIGNKIIAGFGPKRTLMAMSLIGVLVGIPVFCDSGFIILSRLVPSLAASGTNTAQLSLALSSGLYTTHTLVPPTPGPLAAAANLGLTANLGLVILIGLVGSLPVALIAYLFARKLGTNIETTQSTHIQTNASGHSTVLVFLPLVLPIILISCGSLPGFIPAFKSWSSFFQIAGNPSFALLIGLACSFMLISGNQKGEWPTWISEALKDAGIIILITGAGGAFGGVIKSSGVDVILKDYVSTTEAGGTVFLLIAFFLAAILKTAQGSSTSALIITSSLLAPLTPAAGFISSLDLAILVLAIGGGAMTISHANDSYFWVVSQFSGISERSAYKSYTLITLAQGLTALVTSILLYIAL